MNALSPAGGSPQGAALLRELQGWAGQGALRPLDLAFAGFVLELAPQAAPTVVMCAALLAHMESLGHACLPIDGLLADAAALLGWLAVHTDALHQAMVGLPVGVEGWTAALRGCALVDAETSAAHTPNDIVSSAPMVLRGSRLYLRRYWHHERRIAQQVRLRCSQVHAVDTGAANAALTWLFPAGESPAAEAGPPIDWQKVACALSLRAGLTIITGGPGTGKTHTAARLLALLVTQQPAHRPLRVALAAPTGKAAARLGQSIAVALQPMLALSHADSRLAEGLSQICPARTLHALLGARPDTRKFRFDLARPLPLDLLIVDEASMIHLEMMDALLAALPDDARIVLLGDKDQLASVEAGAVLGELCHGAGQGRYSAPTAAYLQDVCGERLPQQGVQGGSPLDQQTVVLQHSRRFGGAITALAAAVNAGDAVAAKAQLQDGADPAIAWLHADSPKRLLALALHGRAGPADGARDGSEDGYGAYVAQLRRRPLPVPADPAVEEAWVLELLRTFDAFRVLCAVRDGEWGTGAVNLAIEQALTASGAIDRPGDRQGEWYEGRPVMVTRNDPHAGVFNGDIGIVLASPGGSSNFKAHFRDGANLRSVAVGRLPPVETAFALTVHKAQGSEFEHTVLVLPASASRAASRELIYTAVTRARSAFTLASAGIDVLDTALARRTLRFSSLADLIEQPD
ncbi:MAG: exodeoxyribonuclease V subunit alpha [Rubrivivax sp.]